MVRPVATPSTKLIPNSLAQNRVTTRQIGLSVRTYTLSMMTSMNDSPSVRGTNRK